MDSDTLASLINKLLRYAQDTRALMLTSEALVDAGVVRSAAAALSDMNDRIEFLEAALRRIADGGNCHVLLTNPPRCMRSEVARAALGVRSEPVNLQ